jgi:hypothetical protein
MPVFGFTHHPPLVPLAWTASEEGTADRAGTTEDGSGRREDTRHTWRRQEQKGEEEGTTQILHLHTSDMMLELPEPTSTDAIHRPPPHFFPCTRLSTYPDPLHSIKGAAAMCPMVLVCGQDDWI